MTPNNTTQAYRSSADSGVPTTQKSLLKIEFVLPSEKLELARIQSAARLSCDSEDLEMRNIENQKSMVLATNIISENDRNGKKKESANKFYCDGFPPCKQSFTRSEHLARHIRRHTGERPFECYCSQKFSRLDNLRQHAQTVHQNEEIPEDSLAATGFKHQRKPRKERPRASGTRARGNTTGSQTGPIRGHKQNSWSTSSISSAGSAFSCNHGFDRNVSDSTMMASNDHAGLAMRISGQAKSPLVCPVTKLPDSPMRLSTPLTPRSNSNCSESLVWPFGHQPSPTLLQYIPGRRQSVPSLVSNLDNGMDKTSIKSSFVASGLITPSAVFSQIEGSPISKPTIKSEIWPSKDSTVMSDEQSRRRTWHPDTYSMYTRGSQHLKTFNIPQDRLPNPPIVSNKTSSAPLIRLPGIESFFPHDMPRTPSECDTGACITTRNPQAIWHAQIPSQGLSSSKLEHGVEKDRLRFETNRQEGINSWICGSQEAPVDRTGIMSGSSETTYRYNTEPQLPSYIAERSAPYNTPVYSRDLHNAAPRFNTQNLESNVSTSSDIKTQKKTNVVMMVSP